MFKYISNIKLIVGEASDFFSLWWIHLSFYFQPGSTISGSGSHTSNASRRARTRQYFKVAHNSQVDESLFGEAHHVTKRNEMLQDKWSGGMESPIEKEARKRSAGKQKRKNAKNGNDTIQVITKDLIRNLM